MIKYKNLHDQYITEQQALQLDDFSKLHYPLEPSLKNSDN
jgi:hypothetical protein